MRQEIFWILTIAYNVATIFLLKRTFNRLSSELKTMHKDVSRLKLEAHRAVNTSADNATNIMAHHAECKSNFKQLDDKMGTLAQDCNDSFSSAMEMYNTHLNDREIAVKKPKKKVKEEQQYG